MANIFADSNRARIRYIKEGTTSWGTTPVSGQTKELRYTSSTLNASKQTAVSEEIRADRMTADIIEVGANSSGEFNIEFSAGSHDDFQEAFTYGAYTRPMNFASATGKGLEWADTDTLYVKGKDVTAYFTAGRRIRTQGFEAAANNGYFQIATITWNAGTNRTEINVTAATATAEAGTAFTSLYDANDVIVLNNTAIRAGTAGASAFDGNGTNPFAPAIAAGQLSTGQKIYVENAFGVEAGSITFSALPASGTKVKISDGSKDMIFQLGGSVPNGTTAVALGADEDEAAANLATAINRQRMRDGIQCSASADAGVVTVKNLNAVGGSILEVLDTGAVMTVVNFTGGDAAPRGVFTIESATDDVLTVSPNPGTFANAGGMKVTIKGSMLRNPNDPDEITPQSFSFETGFEDVSQYFIADGQRIGTMAYNIASNSILTGSFGLQGRAMTRASTSILGELPYTPLTTTATPVYNATVNVGTLKINGEPLSTAVQSIALNGSNNLRDQNAVSYKFPAGVGAGRLDLTGSLVAYFADGSLWDKFIEHKTVSVEFPLQDVLGNRYEFTVPAANFTTDTVNPSGGNQDIVENLEFTAKRDPVTECQIQIDRFSCVLPVTA